MTRFDRQEAISGWDQSKLADGHVVVAGRGWLATLLVWALCSMGVGIIHWIGRGARRTQTLAAWLLGQPCPFGGCSIAEFPFDPEYESSLDWTVQATGSTPRIFIDCSERGFGGHVCSCFFRKRGVPCAAGNTSGGGWIGGEPAVLGRRLKYSNAREPIIAMAIAALLADRIRMELCPLAMDVAQADGFLNWTFPPRVAPRSHRATGVLIGFGGIGTYAGTLLAALRRPILIVDPDSVQDSNRNRQGLFTLDDAVEGRSKAVAGCNALKRFFPDADAVPCNRRVDLGFSATIARVHPRTEAILSAVDNAQTRLVNQSLGERLGLNVVQGGTDVFSADCVTQVVGGKSLDEQMHGMLTVAAAQEEKERRRGRCATDPSYVVPSMIAGAMLARRFEQLVDDSTSSVSLAPIHWRQGTIPCEGANDEFWLGEDFRRIAAASS